MRPALALLLFAAGCIEQRANPPPGPDPNDGWTGPAGDPLGGCDSLCGNDVCARDGACYPASEIRVVHTIWTVGGAAPSTTSCASNPDLFIGFSAPNGLSFGFAPVPCRTGEFTVDKMPLAYTAVELGPDGGSRTPGVFDDTGTATIDLP